MMVGFPCLQTNTWKHPKVLTTEVRLTIILTSRSKELVVIRNNRLYFESVLQLNFDSTIGQWVVCAEKETMHHRLAIGT
jgi:hypothetical protein